MGPKETVIFEDETGFSLHPRLGRGWAKRGKRLKVPTASIHHPRLNVFGWVAPLLGRMGLHYSKTGNRQNFLECLRQLYRRFPRYTLWVYVDRAAWHKGKEVESFQKAHPRLQVDYLPRYQPGLNAQERIWRQLRYEGTTNLYFESLDSLKTKIHRVTQSWSNHKIKQLCQLT